MHIVPPLLPCSSAPLPNRSRNLNPITHLQIAFARERFRNQRFARQESAHGFIGSSAVLDRPYWFGAQPIVRQTIVALRLIWPDERPHFMRRASDRPQPPPVPLPCLEGNSRRRGHLFVVDGGKNHNPPP